jgi:hypothetical protein
MNIPDIILAKLIREVVGNRQFKVKHKNIDGYIIYKNGYYLFQPNNFIDLEIPLALRGAIVPVRRESFYPGLFRARKGNREGIESESDEESEAESRELIEEDVAEVPAVAAVTAVTAVTAVEKKTIPAYWKYAVTWIQNVIDSDGEKYMPSVDFLNVINSNENAAEKKLLLEKVGALMWLIPSIKRIEGALEIYKKIFLDYIWDEWLSLSEQRELLERKSSDDIKIAARENIIRVDAKTVYRYFNPAAKSFQYICDNGPCPTSVVDYLKVNEPIVATVSKEATGSFYGILVSKKGNIIFKSTSPPAAGKNILKGTECASVSNSTIKIDVLEKAGKILENPDLKREVFWASARKLTARQLCILMDLVLRYMDEKGVQGKRWFYRPVQATITGHLNE